MMGSSALGAALVFTVLLATSLVQAQPSAAQKETARSLMAEGRELREQGDLQGALSRFSAADSIMGVPTTGFEMAATQAELGKLVEARETLRRVLALPQRPDDPEPFVAARAKARGLDQRLHSRIGALHFVVAGVAANETLVITVDGQVVPGAALGLPFRVNPGKHLVVARAGDREATIEADALESRTLRVELPLPAPRTDATAGSDVQLDETPAAARATRQAPQAAPAASPAGAPLVSYVAGAVGVAGILFGGITGMMAISHKNAAARDCVNGRCPPSTWDDLDRARSMAAVSTVGVAVGAVGLAIGTSFLLLHDEPSTGNPDGHVSGLSVSPDLAARGGSLSVSGRF